MPIARLVSAGTFDETQTRAICDAFDSAWGALQAANSALTQPDRAPPAREALAKRIIDMAQRSTLDVTALRDDALEYVQNHPPPV